MKVSIITYHRVYNYGAALQAYATVQCFNRLRYSAEVIDYIPDKVKNYGSFNQILYETKMFHSSLVKCIFISLIKMPSYKKRVPVFDTFLEKNVPMTKVYNSLDELKRFPPRADIYCTGSDQVWNNTYLPQFDLTYFLAFVKSVKKISFSSSFGRKDFSSKEMNEIIPYLREYNAISVREKSGLDLLKDVDVKLKKNILDPTLILTEKEWSSIFEPTSYADYILVYQLHSDSNVEEYALVLSKIFGKKALKISLDYFRKSKCDCVVGFPSVGLFLSLFSKAFFVVTDSFHGTAFSINFNKNFIVALPGKTGERIQSILELTGLTERIVNNDEAVSKIAEKDIDFRHCNEVLFHERNKAIEYLKKAVEM